MADENSKTVMPKQRQRGPMGGRGFGGGRSDGDVDHTPCQWSTFFLRHAFGRTHKLRLFGWRQRQAIDDKFAIILDSHLSHLRTDMR